LAEGAGRLRARVEGVEELREDEHRETLLQEILATAIAICGADSGDLRLTRDDDTLALMARQGLEDDALNDATDAGAAAHEAARMARRIQMDEIALSSLFAPDTRTAMEHPRASARLS
jgi:hypothetical protein